MYDLIVIIARINVERRVKTIWPHHDGGDGGIDVMLWMWPGSSFQHRHRDVMFIYWTLCARTQSNHTPFD